MSEMKTFESASQTPNTLKTALWNESVILIGLHEDLLVIVAQPDDRCLKRTIPQILYVLIEIPNLFIFMWDYGQTIKSHMCCMLPMPVRPEHFVNTC